MAVSINAIEAMAVAAADRTPLYNAIAQNDLPTVKKLLGEQGVQQLSKFEWICTLAAAEGNHDWVYCKPWMQRCDSQTKEMYDYLEMAFKEARLVAPYHSIRFRPLEVNVAKQKFGWNDLIVAVMEDDLEAATRLIKKRPELVLQTDAYGNNALMHAIGEGKVMMAYKIMAVGKLETQALQRNNGLGHNALSLAVIELNNSPHFLNKLLNSLDPAVKKQLMMNRSYKGKTALMLACEMPNEEMVLQLALETDRDILLAKDEGGCFALFHAIWNARVKAVQALLQWFPQDQLLPIEADLGLPVWQYVENIARLKTITMTSDPDELERVVTKKMRPAYLEIASIIKKKYNAISLKATVPLATTVPYAAPAAVAATAPLAAIVPLPVLAAVKESNGILKRRKHISPTLVYEKVAHAHNTRKKSSGPLANGKTETPNIAGASGFPSFVPLYGAGVGCVLTLSDNTAASNATVAVTSVSAAALSSATSESFGAGQAPHAAQQQQQQQQQQQPLPTQQRGSKRSHVETEDATAPVQLVNSGQEIIQEEHTAKRQKI